jgi:kynurenine formamidase
MGDDASEAVNAVRAVAAKLSNWGRWGESDERGTLNHITPEAVARAAKCVRRGKVFSLALPLDDHGPMDPHVHGRFNAHVWYDDRLYNGYPADSITAGGAKRCAISNLRENVVGRAVLADVARWKGVDILPDDYGISPDDLDATLAHQKCEIATGDIVLLRTGCVGAWQRDGSGLGLRQPGLAFECAAWLHAHNIAAVAADNIAVERLTPAPGQPMMGLHMIALRDMGMPFGELFVLDELAKDCSETGVYEMMLCAAPLYFPRAVGSPLNPLAIK